MKMQKIVVPLVAATMIVGSYVYYQWTGVAFVASGLVMWALLHFNRLLQVLKRAADRPIGYVGSAEMLNAKLQPGVTLLNVMARTQALGELLSEKDAQPEIYRWTDGTQSHVTCTFKDGKLQQWTLVRPEPAESDVTTAAPVVLRADQPTP